MTNEQEALRRLEAGEKPTFSTGICGNLTAGYGQLSQDGYFKYPLPEDRIEEYLMINEIKAILDGHAE